MTIASTNLVALAMNNEATWNEVPASPPMSLLRFTGESLTYKKKTVQSETIRSDRMRDTVALVGFDTTGDINYELYFFDFDFLLEGALANSYVGAKTVTATTISFTSTTIADSGNGLGAIPVGASVWVTGSSTASLNRRYKVTASAAGALTVSPAPATTASAGDTIVISSSAVSVVTSVSVTATVSGSTVTFGGGTGFNPATGTGIVAGQWVQFAGFANAGNNGIFRVTAVTSTAITVSATLASESVAASTTLTFSGRLLRNGVAAKSFHLQKAFTDISQYISFRGMRVEELKMDIQSQQIIKGSFSFMGGRTVRAGTTAAGTTLAAETSPIMTASANVGQILQNGTAIPAGVKQIQLSVKNNLRALDQIGTLYPIAINYGFADVTGQADVYFQDNTLYDQLINHTSTELSWTTTDQNGNAYVITLPSVLFTDGFPTAGSGNSDVMIPLNFQAVRNATYNCEIQIDAIPSLS